MQGLGTFNLPPSPPIDDLLCDFENGRQLDVDYVQHFRTARRLSF